VALHPTRPQPLIPTRVPWEACAACRPTAAAVRSRTLQHTGHASAATAMQWKLQEGWQGA